MAELKRRLGILGGGQLAMYMCDEARRLGLDTMVLAHSQDAPAVHTADQLRYGDLSDLELIAELVDRVDVITFDIEEVPPPTLKYLASRAAQGDVAVHPAPATMLVLQDKLLQKQWLLRNGLPTLPFRAFAAEDDAERAGCFGYPLVQKARRGGYDGRGVQIIRSEQQRETLWPVASLIEPFLEGVRELAILAARSSSGEVVCFDPVELVFDGKRNVLDMVVAPAPITQRQAALARAIAHRTLNRLDSVGLFALELFLTRDGDLVINEISPRVHNSGHHTLESCETSQFEQHLRAVIGLPLGSTLQLQPCVMHNLLSSTENNQSRGSEAFEVCNLQQHTFIHWYGKKTATPGRKMGHVTALGDTTDIARERAAAALHSASRLPATAA